MCRALIVIMVLTMLCVPARHAWATEQIEERIIVDGRVFRMDVVPLDPLLKKLGKRPLMMEPVATSLWRGYIGTWLLDGDEMYLVSLCRPGYEGKDSYGNPRRITKDIPLSIAFGEQRGPIPALWWSGQIVVPRGRMLVFGYGSRRRLHEKALYLNVEHGRVTARHLVDNRREGRGLSREDIQWVTKAHNPPKDDGQWRDARTIRTEAFQNAVPAGTPFRTRGYLAVARNSLTKGTETHLYVRWTPATDMVRLPIPQPPESMKLGTFLHAELTATWMKADRDIVLKVVSWRALEPGETMHHPDYIVPPLPESRLPAGDTEPGSASGHTIRGPSDLSESLFGHNIVLRGTLAHGEVASIHGVEVEADPQLDGQPVVSAGMLEKWIVTQKLIDGSPTVAKLFGSRGPGTYYRLVHPRTGELSLPRHPD